MKNEYNEYNEHQELLQKYYEENPCFNGEYHDNSIIEELIKYRNSECEMGG